MGFAGDAVLTSVTMPSQILSQNDQMVVFCYHYGMKNDRYKKARGGWSRILDIRCEKCEEHIAFYQKDGPGPLKRMYLDRMSEHPSDSEKLACSNCNETLGTKIIYKKEDRPAYRLFVGSVTKKITKAAGI